MLEILPIIVVALATYLYIFVKMYQNVYFLNCWILLYISYSSMKLGLFFFFKKKEVF